MKTEKRATAPDRGEARAPEDPSASQVAEARCSGCPELQGFGRCLLRAQVVQAPRDSVCANHPTFGLDRRAAPLGPVFELLGEELRPTGELPASEQVRQGLLDALSELNPDRVEDLGFRDRVAIWHARRLGDRRTLVHLDWIRAGLDAAGDRSIPFVPSASGLFERVILQPGVLDERGRFDPARISLPGRLLVASSFAVMALAFWAQMEVLDRLFRPGANLWPIFPVTSLLLAAAWVRVGIAVLRRRGIPFVSEDEEGS